MSPHGGRPYHGGELSKREGERLANAGQDRAEVAQLVTTFANSFDLKDWDELRRCLAEDILVDYSDLRGTPPERLSATEYVRSRQTALEELQTLHLLSNQEIELGRRKARSRTAFVIYRRAPSEQGVRKFDTYGYYEHDFCKTEDGWKICAIRQRVLWNEGDSSIHPGTQQT